MNLVASALAVLFASATVSHADAYLVYPTGPLNPRVPNIPLEAGGADGNQAPFEATFEYALAPSVQFPEGGAVSVAVRDNMRRPGKDVLVLTGDGHDLRFRIKAAADDRTPELELRQGERVVESLQLDEPLDASWVNLRIEWDNEHLSFYKGQTQVGTFALPEAFKPERLSIATWHVDALRIEADGTFTLGWENDYAAAVTMGEQALGVDARLFGFDTYVVSGDPAKRDYPMIQVVNRNDEEQQVVFEFELHGEVTERRTQWQQTITVPARSARMVSLHFPVRLENDVYHLTVRSGGLDRPIEERKNFVHVLRRDEPAGPPKFGLHDSNTRAFGYWPDALPIDLLHTYARWAYIQGPPWIRDHEGDWGVSADLPPEEWNWTLRTDWAVQEGRIVYACLISTPMADWMRTHIREGSRTREYDWGLRGGVPDEALYRRFVRAFAERYEGQIAYYEIENEPNAGGSYISIDEYVDVARAVYEEVKSVDSDAQVFGISGTSDFVPWMARVFEKGGDAYMDGVAWHTYVTPSLPEEADLYGKLAEAHEVIAATGRDMPVLNSETGAYVAVRDRVDEPMSQARIDELMAEGIEPIAVSRGWPHRAITEQEGAIYTVTNAVINFMHGTKYYTFFGWNPDWPTEPEWWGKGGLTGFSMITSSREGERTPSLYTLATAVLTTQLEGADHQQIERVQQHGMHGAMFPKVGGGEVAVLWSTTGSRTVLIQSDQPTLELVDLYGQGDRSVAAAGDGTYLHTIELTKEPIYVHVDAPSLTILPSPVERSVVEHGRAGGGHVVVSVRNVFEEPWEGRVAMKGGELFEMQPAERDFRLEPGERTRVAFEYQAKPGAAQTRHAVPVHLQLPTGEVHVSSAEIAVTASFAMPEVAASASPTSLREVEMPGGRLMLNAVEQLSYGKPPALASLQEEGYWAGPDELSGEAKVACNEEGLLVYIEVRDAQPRLPEDWPSVDGATVELFFDFRTAAEGLGTPVYDEHVHQFVIRPAVETGQTPKLWHPSSSRSAELPNVAVEGGPIDEATYWVGLFVPWDDLEQGMPGDRPIGFDVAINGSHPDRAGRKNQIILFGNASNYQNASRFGLGFFHE